MFTIFSNDWVGYQLRKIVDGAGDSNRVSGFCDRYHKDEALYSSIKRKKFRSACQRLLKKVAKGHRVRLRTLASLSGKLQSIAPAVPFCWLHLQAVVQTIRQRTEEAFWRSRWEAVVLFKRRSGSSDGGFCSSRIGTEAQLFRNQRVSTCFQTRQTRAMKVHDGKGKTFPESSTRSWSRERNRNSRRTQENLWRHPRIPEVLRSRNQTVYGQRRDLHLHQQSGRPVLSSARDSIKNITRVRKKEGKAYGRTSSGRSERASGPIIASSNGQVGLVSKSLRFSFPRHSMGPSHSRFLRDQVQREGPPVCHMGGWTTMWTVFYM